MCFEQGKLLGPRLLALSNLYCEQHEIHDKIRNNFQIPFVSDRQGVNHVQRLCPCYNMRFVDHDSEQGPIAASRVSLSKCRSSEFLGDVAWKQCMCSHRGTTLIRDQCCP